VRAVCAHLYGLDHIFKLCSVFKCDSHWQIAAEQEFVFHTTLRYCCCGALAIAIISRGALEWISMVAVAPQPYISHAIKCIGDLCIADSRFLQ
jgi:hypothetical protein